MHCLTLPQTPKRGTYTQFFPNFHRFGHRFSTFQDGDVLWTHCSNLWPTARMMRRVLFAAFLLFARYHVASKVNASKYFQQKHISSFSCLCWREFIKNERKRKKDLKRGGKTIRPPKIEHFFSILVLETHVHLGHPAH